MIFYNARVPSGRAAAPRGTVEVRVRGSTRRFFFASWNEETKKRWKPKSFFKHHVRDGYAGSVASGAEVTKLLLCRGPRAAQFQWFPSCRQTAVKLIFFTFNKQFIYKTDEEQPVTLR